MCVFKNSDVQKHFTYFFLSIKLVYYTSDRKLTYLNFDNFLKNKDIRYLDPPSAPPHIHSARFRLGRALGLRTVPNSIVYLQIMDLEGRNMWVNLNTTSVLISKDIEFMFICF